MFENAHGETTGTVERPDAVATVTAVACDHRPLVREGLAAMLGGVEGIELAGSVPDSDLVSAVRLYQPDLLIVGLSQAADDPFRSVATARALHPDMHVVGIIEDPTDADLREAVVAGVDALLLFSAPASDIRAAIAAAMRGEQWITPQIAMRLAGSWQSEGGGDQPSLTRRELDVLTHLADGLTNQQIGDALGVSARTVKTHVQHLLEKLDVPDRTGAVGRGFRLGLIR